MLKTMLTFGLKHGFKLGFERGFCNHGNKSGTRRKSAARLRRLASVPAATAPER